MNHLIRRRAIALGTIATLALSACGSTAESTTTGDDTATTSATETSMATETSAMNDMDAAIVGMQTTFTDLTSQVAAMDPGSDVATAWNDVSGDLQQAFADFQSGTEIDPAALQESLDSFEETATSSDVGQEFLEGWTTFRTELDGYLAQYTG